MSSDVITALIGLVGSGIGSIIGIICNTRLTTYRIKELEKKVDKHNTVVERTYKVEERLSVIDEEIKVANHRISDLEERR
nr:MAG TPA: hemolysin XhlA [Caudoviricetes sp.]